MPGVFFVDRNLGGEYNANGLSFQAFEQVVGKKAIVQPKDLKVVLVPPARKHQGDASFLAFQSFIVGFQSERRVGLACFNFDAARPAGIGKDQLSPGRGKAEHFPHLFVVQHLNAAVIIVWEKIAVVAMPRKEKDNHVFFIRLVKNLFHGLQYALFGGFAVFEQHNGLPARRVFFYQKVIKVLCASSSAKWRSSTSASCR